MAWRVSLTSPQHRRKIRTMLVIASDILFSKTSKQQEKKCKKRQSVLVYLVDERLI